MCFKRKFDLTRDWCHESYFEILARGWSLTHAPHQLKEEMCVFWRSVKIPFTSAWDFPH